MAMGASVDRSRSGPSDLVPFFSKQACPEAPCDAFMGQHEILAVALSLS